VTGLWTTGAADGRAATGRLTLRTAARQAFGGSAAIGADAAHRARLHTYLSDVVRPAGLALRADVVADGSGHSYGEMAEALLTPALGEDRAVDLIVLVHAVPDVTPGRATAAYLSHLCPGNRMAFAVCDQGSAAAFTGINIIREYTRTAGCTRALLLVLEQSVLPYDLPPGAPAPDLHSGVALLWEADARPTGGAPTMTLLRQLPGIAPDEVTPALRRELAQLPGHEVIASAALADACAGMPAGTTRPGGTGLPAGTRVAPAGMPATGVWWALGAILTRPVALADYDPVLGYLSLCALTPGA
jgi:4-hydroxymandelate oxidase